MGSAGTSPRLRRESDLRLVSSAVVPFDFTVAITVKIISPDIASGLM